MLLVLLAASTGCARESKVQEANIPEALPARLTPAGTVIGWLGRPLGSYVTIEGKVKAAPMAPVSDAEFGNGLMVEKVDDQVLKTPIFIQVDGLHWSVGETMMIKGFEAVRTVGDAPGYADYSKELGIANRWEQAGWQVQCYFVPLRVVKPEGLGIRKAQ